MTWIKNKKSTIVTTLPPVYFATRAIHAKLGHSQTFTDIHGHSQTSWNVLGDCLWFNPQPVARLVGCWFAGRCPHSWQCLGTMHMVWGRSLKQMALPFLCFFLYLRQKLLVVQIFFLPLTEDIEQ